MNWALCLPAACTEKDAELALKSALSDYNTTVGIKFTVEVDPNMCYVKQKSQSYSKETIGVLYVSSYYWKIALPHARRQNGRLSHNWLYDIEYIMIIDRKDKYSELKQDDKIKMKKNILLCIVQRKETKRDMSDIFWKMPIRTLWSNLLFFYVYDNINITYKLWIFNISLILKIKEVRRAHTVTPRESVLS